MQATLRNEDSNPKEQQPFLGFPTTVDRVGSSKVLKYKCIV
jgi:hypothetical protein